MNWMEGISKAIAYMEAHLKEEISAEDIAKEACVSSFYFQTAFSILCGFSVAEYIRLRRLSLAGSELIATDKKIIDIALDYGYNSPDSFTKAFTRYHGVTPTVVRRERTAIKSFAPLKIQFTLKGGISMEYRIVEKEAFTVMGVSKRFEFSNSYEKIPQFWTEHCQSEKCKTVCGMYGICLEDGGKEDFRYLIADNYIPWEDVPDGFETFVIPKLTWAVFACRGAMPKALQEVNTRIFSEWLPNNQMYEVAANYNVELYSPCEDYEKGNQDEKYGTEIWIPVKKRT